MLQEIISQMYVDPELLEQLSDENKQILFTKIREEQVRRWKVQDKKLEKKPAKRAPRKINFNLGADGKPWVWVMGEHKDDLPYEELVRRREKEELDKERQTERQELKEAEELAKKETMSIQSLSSVLGAVGKFKRPLKKSKGVDFPDGAAPLPPRSSMGVVRTESHNAVAGMATDSPTTRRKVQEQEEEELKRTLTKQASIIGVTPEEQDKFEKHRTEELYMSLQRARSISKKRAENMAKNVEDWWQEAHKKANEFDRVRRTSFKKAVERVKKCPDIPDKIFESIPEGKKQEIYRRMTIERKPKKPISRRQAPGPPDTSSSRFKKQSSFVRPGTVPKTTAHVVSWFNRNEAPKGTGQERDGSISVWFHGKLSRDGAVKLLESKPVGSYVLRLSSKIWGYTISVKTYTDCKHFLIDASSGQYCFVGPKQHKFRTLLELIKFYRANPITWSGQEVLLIPVVQEEENPELYRGLYDDEGISEDILEELASAYEGSTL